MRIAGFIKTSLIEWPGKIASVIFVPGCNFRCPFCHNADLVGDKVERFTRIPEKQIFADLQERKKWVDGVVITGGEPTLQTDLSRFLSGLKQMGLLRMVHTNGSRPEVVEKLIKEELVGYWAMDVKGNFENYDRYVGGIRGIRGIRESMKLIINSGKEYEFRTTIVPGLHDQVNLINLAKQIKEILNTKYLPCRQAGLILNTRWFLQQFRSMNCYDKKYLKVKPFSKQQMEMFLEEIQKIIPQAALRGV